MGQKHRICIITTVHDYNDNRIFHKQAKSLANCDYNVTIIAPGTEDKIEDGIKILSISKKANRSFRMILSGLEAYRKAVLLNCHIYHFHDPEFLPFALLLKIKKKVVFYDVHEDVPVQLLNKYWLWRPIRSLVSKVFNFVEKWASNHLNAIITATSVIANKFKSDKTKVVVIQNYPRINSNLEVNADNYERRSFTAVYVGSISIIRGVKEMLQVCEFIPEKYNFQLLLGGTFAPPALKEELELMSGWDKVNYLGWLDRARVYDYLTKARLGLVLLHPVPNYLEAQPVKLYEYMTAGIPVIASNFSLWKEVIESNQCGLTVDPFDIEAIADAIKYIFDHPGEAEEMGKRGKLAVSERYNWSMEEKKLLDLYNSAVK